MRAATRSVRSVMSVIALWMWASAVCIDVGREARGDTINPITQQRSVTAFVIVPPCGPPNDSESQSAIDFEHFSGEANAARICSAAQGTASATQESDIGAAQLIASGDTASLAESKPNTVIHALPSSYFSVNFSLASPVRYFIEGELSAAGTLPVVAAFSRFRLFTDEDVLLERSVSPAAGGGPNALTVHDAGSLPPGQYTFRIESGAWIDSTVPPNGEGESAYGLIARFQRPGDANIDGHVNVDDLIAVILAWGACPPPPAFCPIDMDNDGAIEVDDLLAVILNWE